VPSVTSHFSNRNKSAISQCTIYGATPAQNEALEEGFRGTRTSYAAPNSTSSPNFPTKVIPSYREAYARFGEGSVVRKMRASRRDLQRASSANSALQNRRNCSFQNLKIVLGKKNDVIDPQGLESRLTKRMYLVSFSPFRPNFGRQNRFVFRASNLHQHLGRALR
jgi:hypothetical protein